MRLLSLAGRYFNRALFYLVLLTPLSVSAEDWIYSFSEGDNLWDFSIKHLHDVSYYEKLRKLNNIENPRQMEPGTKIRVPLEWIRSNAASAELIAASGTVQHLQVEAKDYASTEQGQELSLGDRIRTGDDSTASIRFADGSVITLHSNSELRFDHLSAYGETGMVDTRLYFQQGRMDTRVMPMKGAGSRYEIHTPSAISAVRGTEYRVAVFADTDASNIEVLGGGVQVEAAGEQLLVPAGFGTQVEKGKPPSKARKLLDAPRINAVPDRVVDQQWIVSWEQIEAAKQYRAELSDNADFTTLIDAQLDASTEFPLPELPAGKYYLRVRGVDEIRMEGKAAVVEFTLATFGVVIPGSLQLVYPDDDEDVRTHIQYNSRIGPDAVTGIPVSALIL